MTTSSSSTRSTVLRRLRLAAVRRQQPRIRYRLRHRQRHGGVQLTFRGLRGPSIPSPNGLQPGSVSGKREIERRPDERITLIGEYMRRGDRSWRVRGFIQDVESQNSEDQTHRLRQLRHRRRCGPRSRGRVWHLLLQHRLRRQVRSRALGGIFAGIGGPVRGTVLAVHQRVRLGRRHRSLHRLRPAMTVSATALRATSAGRRIPERHHQLNLGVFDGRLRSAGGPRSAGTRTLLETDGRRRPTRTTLASPTRRSC